MHPAVSHSVVSLSTHRRSCCPCNVAIGYRKDASRGHRSGCTVVVQTGIVASVFRASNPVGTDARLRAVQKVPSGPGSISLGADPFTGRLGRMGGRAPCRSRETLRRPRDCISVIFRRRVDSRRKCRLSRSTSGILSSSSLPPRRIGTLRARRPHLRRSCGALLGSAIAGLTWRLPPTRRPGRHSTPRTTDRAVALLSSSSLGMRPDGRDGPLAQGSGSGRSRRMSPHFPSKRWLGRVPNSSV